MKRVVLVVFTIIAISLSDAHFRKKPNFQIFEIRENQLTKKLQIQPAKLRYDLESEEKEFQASKLSKLLLSQKKRKIDTNSDIIMKIKALKGLNSGKKLKQPVVLIVSPENLDVDSWYHSGQDDVLNGFFDETRTQKLLRPDSEVVFNIVPPERTRKALKQPQFPPILRFGDGVEDRTNAPPPRHAGRPYVVDYGNEHY